MMSSILSQEEIDALLDDNFSSDIDPQNSQDSLSSMEEDALGELANISMGTAATTLSSLLGKRVEITTPHIVITNILELRKNYPRPYVVVDVNYNAGLRGTNIFIINTYDAGIIVDLMMGGDGTNPPLELNDLHLSGVSEAMNQMMGSSCTSLSQILGKRIDITPPSLELFDLSKQEIMGGDDKIVVKIAFHMVIQGLVDSEMMQLIPVPFAKEMVAELLDKNDIPSYKTSKKEDGKTSAAPKKQNKDKAAAPRQVPFSQPQNAAPQPPNVMPQPPNIMPQQQIPIAKHQVPVSPIQFTALSEEPLTNVELPNLGLILDVGLQLSVELGRTHKKIKEILELSVGSIVELDKLAGEPVDILVNGKLLAKGEVVVIDENFGVRVTEIVSPIDRVKNLNN